MYFFGFLDFDFYKFIDLTLLTLLTLLPLEKQGRNKEEIMSFNGTSVVIELVIELIELVIELEYAPTWY